MFIGVEEWTDAVGVFLRQNLDEKSKTHLPGFMKEEIFYLLTNSKTNESMYDQVFERLLDMKQFI